MLKYGFFDAKMKDDQPDRVYSSDDINDFFYGLYTDGIFNIGGAFKVTPGTGLTVNIESGKAQLERHWIMSDATETIDITAAHPIKNRYTSVVIRYDRQNRLLELTTVDGEPDDSPEPPDLQITADIKDMLIANILVRANATEISNDDIIDCRSYVTSLPAAAKMHYRRYIYAHDSAVSEIPITDKYDYTVDTNMQIYVNGLLLRTDEYNIVLSDTSASGYKIVFVNSLNADADIDIVMIS